MSLNLFPLGWVHFIASLAAIAASLLVLARAKGTPVHKRRGRIYVAAILITGVTALGIYRLGMFFFPHWLAVATLVTTAIAFAAVRFRFPRRGWVHVHLTFMLLSVYLLFGGLVNELFLRVDVLRRLVPPNLNSPIVGRTHFAVMLLFAALIVYFNAREWRRRAPLAAAKVETEPVASG